MADFVIKSGDRLPAITGQLLDGDGNPIDLTGATVSWVMRGVDDDELEVDALGTIDVDPTTGRVAYFWAAADTDTVGTYIGEWRVTFSDTRQQTFPPEGGVTVEVTEPIASGLPISAEDLDWIRSWVGTSPDDDVIGARLERAGTRARVALAVLRERRADLMSDPTKYSIRGDVSVDTGQNLAFLDAQISALETAVAAEDGTSAPGELAGAVLVRRGGGWSRAWPPDEADLYWR